MSSAHDKYAQNYDEQIRAYDCYLAEVLFGLCYEGIREGEKLLDVGIGTGLSSRLFRQAGLRILGLDSSGEMLEVCREKKIAEELVQRDLLDVPWPYEPCSIDHVVSCGVFHFIGDLEAIFAEVQRIQKSNGIFAFTIMKRPQDEADGQNYDRHIEEDIPIFAHRAGYLDELLRNHRYEILKDITCLVGATAFQTICARPRRGAGL